MDLGVTPECAQEPFKVFFHLNIIQTGQFGKFCCCKGRQDSTQISPS